MHVSDIVSDRVVFFQAEDGIRDLVRSRGLGDVYKRQEPVSRASATRRSLSAAGATTSSTPSASIMVPESSLSNRPSTCLLYTSDAADERSSVDLGGRRIIKKKNKTEYNMLR